MKSSPCRYAQIGAIALIICASSYPLPTTAQPLNSSRSAPSPPTRIAQTVPPDYQSVLAALKTRIPVLLPTEFPVPEKIYGHLETSTQESYAINLDYTPTCYGAAACTLGRFSGKALSSKPAALQGKPVLLLNHIQGYLIKNDKEENCNTGYCFSKLTWDLQGYRYSLKLKSGDLTALIKTANSALKYREHAIDETLLTQQFKIVITRHCPEGSVTCDNVTYQGKNLQTGESIRLSGKTIHTLCADGVTPCRFVGYEFRHRHDRYVVTETGFLQIWRGDRQILLEKGVWQR